MACACPLFLLPTDLINSMILPNVGLADLANVDSACCSRKSREEWAAVCRKAPPVDLVWQLSTTYSALCWLSKRRLRAKNVYISEASRKTVDLIVAEPDLAESVRIFGDPSFLEGKIEGNTHFADKVTRWSGCTGNSKVSSGYFKNLAALRINYNRSNAAWATETISNNPKLTSLEVTFNIAPEDSFFAALAASGATVSQLTVNFADAVEGGSLLNRFAQCCPALQELCFDLASDIQEHWDTTPLSAKQIDGIPMHCRDLRVLRIDKAEVPESSLRRLMRLCPKLQKLHVPDTTVADRELLALSARCADGYDPNPLTHLSVSWAVTDRNAIFNCAGLLENLQSLEVTDGGFAEWIKLPIALIFMSQLRTLRFVHSSPYSDLTLTEDILSAVAENCSRLRRLEVLCPTEDCCDDGFAEVLSQCHGLEYMELPNVMLSDDAFLGITTGAEGGSLKSIRFNAGEFSDEGMEALARHFPALQIVDVSNATYVTDDTLLALAQHCPRLRDVVIHDTEEAFAAAAVMTLCQGCPRLRRVEVNNAHPSDGEMGALRQRLSAQGRKIKFH